MDFIVLFSHNTLVLPLKIESRLDSPIIIFQKRWKFCHSNPSLFVKITYNGYRGFSRKEWFGYRASGGRLHLVPGIGKIPLADAILIEDPSEDGEYCESFSFKRCLAFFCGLGLCKLTCVENKWTKFYKKVKCSVDKYLVLRGRGLNLCHSILHMPEGHALTNWACLNYKLHSQDYVWVEVCFLSVSGCFHIQKYGEQSLFSKPSLFDV